MKERLINIKKKIKPVVSKLLRRTGEVMCTPLQRPWAAWMLSFGVLTSVLIIAGQWLYPPSDYELQIKYEPKSWEMGWNCVLSLGYGLLCGYIVTAIMVALPKWLGRIWMTLCMLLAVIDAGIDAGCIGMLRRNYNRLFVEIMGATNPEEVRGFFATYFHIDFIWLLAAALLVGAIVWVVGRTWMPRRVSAPAATASILGMMACGVVLWSVGPAWLKGLTYKFESLNNDYLLPNVVAANPALERTRPADEAPELLIVVFGESLSSTKCSLYGYAQPTQPMLEERLNDSTLYVFGPGESVGFYTIMSFRYHMSTYDKEHPDKGAWNTEPNIIEVARKAGYSTQWLSNQRKAGRFENIITRYAQFADKAYFTNEATLDLDEDAPAKYDEELLPMIREHFPAEGKKSMMMVHLMGNHPYYGDRYPEKFNHFSAKDYESYPKNQRLKRRLYDNSVLYNDSIINEIIKMTDGRKAMVLYFSDHGSDIYDSDPKYCGHGRTNKKSVAACQKVPILMYVSPELRESAPQLMERLNRAGRHPQYNTTNLIYTINDILGQRFSDRPNGPSLLEEETDAEREIRLKAEAEAVAASASASEQQ